MTTNEPAAARALPTFYTVPETARILRVDPATIYRAIRDGEFPAVRLRGRYVIPLQAVERIAAEAAASLACVDVARLAEAGGLSLNGSACPCGAAPEAGESFCRKCQARARWERRRIRRDGPADGGR